MPKIIELRSGKAESYYYFIVIIPLLHNRPIEERGFAHTYLITTLGLLLKGQGPTHFKRPLPFPKTSPEKRTPTSSGKQRWHHGKENTHTQKKIFFKSEGLACPHRVTSSQLCELRPITSPPLTSPSCKATFFPAELKAQREMAGDRAPCRLE